MISKIQPFALSASPRYPNSIAWSEENLLAISNGHMITILNPSLISGPRGFIILRPDKPFPLGLDQIQDPHDPCLLPMILACGTPLPRARSISWSPSGLAPNSGCLLSVCSAKGSVKIYCFPRSNLCAEWTEVVDISDMLCRFFSNTNFSFLSTNFFHDSGISENVTKDDNQKFKSGITSTKTIKNEARSIKRRKVNESFPQHASREYASRSALVESHYCAWSPIVHSFSGCSLDHTNKLPNKCAILAVGSKSGHIFFFRVDMPKSCNIEDGNSVKAVLVGTLSAHNSWITAISWSLSKSDSSNPHLNLATGCSDGSVKLWVGAISGLAGSFEVNNACFSLLKELVPVNSVPVSTISMVVPAIALDKIILAVGNGSGCLESWVCHASSRKFESSGICRAHDSVVTGLEWTFNGDFLYSSGQEGSLRIWALCGRLLRESSFPNSTPKIKPPNNVIELSDHCYGLALSPGNLMLTFVHDFDSEKLNPMYQARNQKAGIHFLWMGGRFEVSSDKTNLDRNMYGLSNFLDKELMSWQSDILSSLKKYEDADNDLVLWDILLVLSSFKKLSPKFAEHVLCEWLSSWFPNFPSKSSIKNILYHAESLLSILTTRKLHLLSIMSRRLMLAEVLPDRWSGLVYDYVEDCQNDELSLWKNLLAEIEKELCKRLLSFFLKVNIYFASHPFVNWVPFSTIHMEQWANMAATSDRLKLLITESRGISCRDKDDDEKLNETCSICSSSVPFEFPEYGFCRNTKNMHKLTRCSVSMKLCRVTKFLWFCMCCHRYSEISVPVSFFTMLTSPLEANFMVLDSDLILDCSKPMCPFCGVFLSRHQSEFHLSISPV